MIEIQTGSDLTVVCRRSGDLDLTIDAVENVMSLLFVCQTCGIEQVSRCSRTSPDQGGRVPRAAPPPASRTAGGVVDSARDDAGRVAVSQARPLISKCKQEREAT